MGQRFYSAAVGTFQFIRSQCIRDVVLHRERGDRTGGFLLACTHVSHLEPAIMSCLVPRTVHWMARKEFFRFRIGAALMRWGNAFSVDRQGIPVRAVRRAIDLVRSGEVVGIFPEGGVKRKEQAMFRGGPMKHGVCVIAHRAQVPIVPAVILGTERLNTVEPWLPRRRARVWVAFGNEIKPCPPNMHRRRARHELAGVLQQEFIRTYQELLEHSSLADADVP